MATFVDTSIWYASSDSSDQYHCDASLLLEEATALITSSLVAVETWQLARYRANFAVAEKLVQGIFSIAEVVHPVHGDFTAAGKIADHFEDQEFSLVDRTSFAIMERLGINKVASLDIDFSVYRFGPQSKRAFEVVAVRDC